MSDKITVLVVGSTGKLGNTITKYLATYPNIKVKAMVRQISPADEEKLETIQYFKSKGVELVEGTVQDQESIIKAVNGSNVVIAALPAGDETVLINGQRALIDASAANGVKLFVPSIFQVSSERLTQEDNPLFYKKVKVAEYARSKGLKTVGFTNGGWFEYLWLVLFHKNSSQLQYYGDVDAPVQAISMVDTAKYVAAVVSKPEMYEKLPDYFNLAAEEDMSLRKLAQNVNETRNTNIKLTSLGSNEDARKLYQEALKKDPSNFLVWFMYSVQAIYNSKAVTPQYQNYMIPEIKPQTFKQWLQANPTKFQP